jgi:hypothetical protein
VRRSVAYVQFNLYYLHEGKKVKIVDETPLILADVLVESKCKERLIVAKSRFVSTCLDNEGEDITLAVYEFSHLIFVCLGIHMEYQEVVRICKPIKKKIDFNRLYNVIFERQYDHNPYEQLLKVCNFVERICLEAVFLARSENSEEEKPKDKPKVAPRHMYNAFFRVRCPFRLEGIC